MSAVIAQKRGLELSVTAEPGTLSGLIRVRLQGTGFQAEIAVVNEPLEGCEPLAVFLQQAADLQPDATSEWRTACRDLSFQLSAGDFEDGLLLLKVTLWSTSDDECDWHVTGSLLLTPSQLRAFARAVLREGPSVVL